MSEIYEIGWIKLDLSPDALKNVSPWKLRNLRVSYREAIRITLWDNDMSIKKDLIHDSKKMTKEELWTEIKRLIDIEWKAKIEFKIPENFEPVLIKS